MSRRYWWANQTFNYRSEIRAGRLWAAPNKTGQLHAGRRLIRDLAPGDLVFHYHRKAIRALSVVTVGATELDRPPAYPAADPGDPDRGWVVYVDPLITDLSVSGDEVAMHLPHATDTLDRHGVPNRRYLSQLTERDARTLTHLAGVSLPLEESLAGHPWDEMVSPADTTDARRWAAFRREQASLRQHLLRGQEEGTCAICESALPAQLLVAAHIKPRRDCTNEERLNFDSVAMLVCALGCDVLFEWGYLVVDEHGLMRTGRPTNHLEVGRRVQALVGRQCHRHDRATAPFFAARAADALRN